MSDPLDRIREALNERDSALIAYSGGVDSTLLAYLAHSVYGDRMIAVFAHSPFISQSAQVQARSVAHEVNFPFDEIDHPGFSGAAPDDRASGSTLLDNPHDRCYLCKRTLLEELTSLSDERGFATVMHGENTDDLLEDRPGAKAARELGVIAPFVEAGIDKETIRALARKLGLPNADAPSDSCLATRFGFGTRLDQGLLDEVAATEDRLRGLFPHATRIRARIR